jgi:hypothetical protein
MQRISHFMRLKSRLLQIFLWMTSQLFAKRREEGLLCSDIRFDRDAVNRKKSEPIFIIASTDLTANKHFATSVSVPFQFPFRDSHMAVC